MAGVRQPSLEIVTCSPEESLQFGVILGKLLTGGDLVLLAGAIGAGKTILARGIAAGLGVRSPVSSPTFTLVMEHEYCPRQGGRRRLYHVDLYRLSPDADEPAASGLEEYLLDQQAVVILEWPERARDLLPAEYLLVHLSMQAESHRLLQVSGAGAHYSGLVRKLEQEVAGSD